MWFGLLKKNQVFNIYFYDKLFYLLVNTNNNKILYIFLNYFYYKTFLDAQAYITYSKNILSIKLPNLLKLFNFFFKNFIKKIYFFSNMFLFRKIKFDGKGYYLYKNKRNVLGLQFNYSHKLNVYSNFIFIKNFTKRSWVFFGINNIKLFNLVSYFKYFRGINIFTLRGIRFSNQVIFNKKRKN